MTKLLFGLLLFIVGCNSGELNQTYTPPQDTSSQNNPAATATLAKTSIKPLTHRNEIIGVWQSENKEPITVEITKDSIYYTEHFESHEYKLKSDSIFINYPDFVFVAKVYFNRDTMVMESEDGKSKFVKLKL